AKVEQLVGDAAARARQQARGSSGRTVGGGQRGARIDRCVVVDRDRQRHTVGVAAGLGGGLEVRILPGGVALILRDEVIAADAIFPAQGGAGVAARLERPRSIGG